MRIRWEIYRRAKEFKLIDAAFLWLEIEPSEELLASPPYNVKVMQQGLNDALDDIVSKELIQHAKEVAAQEGISKVDVLKRLFSNPPEPPESFSRRGIAHEVVRIFGIDSDTLTEDSWENLTREWCAKTDLERVVSRDKLLKVAEAWNESPKFLFSEASEHKISRQLTKTDQIQHSQKYDSRKQEKNLILVEKLISRLPNEDAQCYRENYRGLDCLDEAQHLSIISELLERLKIDASSNSACGVINGWFESSRDERMSRNTIKRILEDVAKRGCQ